MQQRKVRGWLAAAALLVAATSWAAVTVNGAGATFPYPLYSKWIDVYSRAKGVQVNYSSVGSGKGIATLKDRTVDFAGSDAPLSDADLKAMPGRVLHIPSCAGAVTLAYNVNLSRQLKLDPATLTAIYMGQIRVWDDARLKALNPGVALPHQPIVVCHRSDGSGTTYIFTSYLAAVSRAWKDHVGAGKEVKWPAGLGAPGNEGVAGLITQNPGAIGYVELAFTIQKKMHVAALKNKAGRFVTPSLASTTEAMAGAIAALKKDVRSPILNSGSRGAYPIAGMTFLLLYQQQRDRAKGQALVDFITWCIHHGQRYNEGLLYAKLPPDLVKINEATLRSVHLP